MADLEWQHAMARGPFYMVIATAALTMCIAFLAWASTSTSDARARYDSASSRYFAQSLRADRIGAGCDRMFAELIASADPKLGLDPDTVFESTEDWPDFRDVRKYLRDNEEHRAEGAEVCEDAVRESEAALALVPNTGEWQATLAVERWFSRLAFVAFVALLIMACIALRNISSKAARLRARREQLIDAEHAIGRQDLPDADRETDVPRLSRIRGPAVGTTRLARRRGHVRSE